jgi:hypothetical protein
MSMMFGKIDFSLLRAVRRILLSEWDPIGVRSKSATSDEYGSYAIQVYAILSSHGTADQIASYLADVERREMGMPPRDPVDLKECSEHLVHAWNAGDWN